MERCSAGGAETVVDRNSSAKSGTAAARDASNVYAITTAINYAAYDAAAAAKSRATAAATQSRHGYRHLSFALE